MVRLREGGDGRQVLAWVVALVSAAGCVADEPLRYPERRDIPAWWQQTRAFYCPWENSGAGSSLMKYRAHDKTAFEDFTKLDEVLADARELGTDTIYLVGWWDPDYENKGNYEPKIKAGGAKALREGIEKVHARGGRVLLYLEALIISRKSELGRTKGPDWAMMDAGGNYHSYYGTGDRFYVMYPGEGSGWVEYIVGVAERLAREYKIDGVHLDSYGVHLDHVKPDHNPKHPNGIDVETFHRGAVRLVREMREAMRRHVPDAVVILEGAERTDLLDVCDGAQFECLSKLKDKSWHDHRRYPIFTSSFVIEEMNEILEAGHNLALSPWWFRGEVRGRDEKRLKEKTDKRSRVDQLESLHIYHNILYANGLLPKPAAHFQQLEQGIIEELNKREWQGEFDYPPLKRVADAYMRVYEQNEEKLTRRPADAIREFVQTAEGKQKAWSQDVAMPVGKEEELRLLLPLDVNVQPGSEIAFLFTDGIIEEIENSETIARMNGTGITWDQKAVKCYRYSGLEGNDEYISVDSDELGFSKKTQADIVGLAGRHNVESPGRIHAFGVYLFHSMTAREHRIHEVDGWQRVRYLYTFEAVDKDEYVSIVRVRRAPVSLKLNDLGTQE